MKTCKVCKTAKPAAEFNKCKSNADGLHSYCRACQREKDAQYRAANKQKRAAYDKQYRAAHKAEIKARTTKYAKDHRETEAARHRRWAAEHPEKRRASRKESKRKYYDRLREQGGSYTAEQLQECLSYFESKCAYTGEPLASGYHLDHVIPISKGGTSAIHNIVPCIAEVNAKKHDKEWESWYTNSPYFSPERYEKIKQWIE